MNKRLLWYLIFLLLCVMPLLAQDYQYDPSDIGLMCCTPVLDLDYSDPNVAYQEALRRIEEARITGARGLNLRQMGLTTVPPEIGQLTSLEELALDGNPLTILPPEIGLLSQLHVLLLFDSGLRTLPPEIGQLSQLEFLELRGVPTTTLPPEIGQLRQLKALSLYASDVTILPPEIGQLNQLQSLDLRSTRLRRLPPEMGRLRNLNSLNIEDLSLYFPPYEARSQGTPAMLAYLRDYETMQARQTMAGIAAGVGAISGVLLLFWWRQRRGLGEKKKRL